MTHARPCGPLVGRVQPPFYDVISVPISPFQKQFSSTSLSFGPFSPEYEALILVIFISDMSLPVGMLEAIMAFLPKADAEIKNFSFVD